jgi:cellobiose phosphorylase
MYQAAIGDILGLRREGASLSINPAIPAIWQSYSVEWRIGGGLYRINVSNPSHRSSGVATALLDGSPVDPHAIPLADDGEHTIEIVLGREDRAISGVRSRVSH